MDFAFFAYLFSWGRRRYLKKIHDTLNTGDDAKNKKKNRKIKKKERGTSF